MTAYLIQYNCNKKRKRRKEKGEMKKMIIEFTKLKKLNEVNNDLVHNYYFLQYGKIYNKEKTKYRPFKYVIFFDNYDLQEYFEDTKITNKNIKYYANEFTPSELYQIKEYDDLEHLKEFFSYCKETIKNYNNIV